MNADAEAKRESNRSLEGTALQNVGDQSVTPPCYAKHTQDCRAPP